MSSTRTLNRATATLIFDGDCGFCTTSVRWLEKHLSEFPIAVPFQWADLESLGVTEAEARDRVWFVVGGQGSGGRRFGGHRAVSALLRRQSHIGWRFLGHLLVAPGFSLIAAGGYALVARYRYKLPGGTPACKMPRR